MKKLENWIEFLEQLNPFHIELGLERIHHVANKLQLSKFNIPIITVTGTNGKGSCVAILEAIYLAQGYRVASYTSPHLFRFNERIRINGKEIDDQSLIHAFEKIEKGREKIHLTYFEFTTLAALQIFQETKLDVIILEVGLGGRLDAVNCVDADVAIITSIGLDHCEWLGQTREAIGNEKAGIFRAGKIAICGDENPPQSVLKYAKDLGVELHVVKPCHPAHASRVAGSRTILQNAATALTCIHLLNNKLPVSEKAIQDGLKNAKLMGRYTKIDNTIFDVGHNPHAAAWLVRQLKNDPYKGKTYAVIGMMADKDIAGTIQELEGEIDAWFWGNLPSKRAANLDQVQKILQQITVKKWYNSTSILEAYKSAQAVCTNNDRVIVLGSFVAVAECLKHSFGHNFGALGDSSGDQN